MTTTTHKLDIVYNGRIIQYAFYDDQKNQLTHPDAKGVDLCYTPEGMAFLEHKLNEYGFNFVYTQWLKTNHGAGTKEKVAQLKQIIQDYHQPPDAELENLQSEVQSTLHEDEPVLSMQQMLEKVAEYGMRDLYDKWMFQKPYATQTERMQKLQDLLEVYQREKIVVQDQIDRKTTKLDYKSGTKIAIQLPGNNLLDSTFCETLADVLSRKNLLWYMPEQDRVVELKHLAVDDKITKFIGMFDINATRLSTLIEKYIVPYRIGDRGYRVFSSLTPAKGKIAIESQQFRDKLPHLTKIIPVQGFFKSQNQLYLCKKGYDAKTKTYVNHDAPDIRTDMTIDDAKRIILDIYKEFAFRTEQDRTNAIAHLFTPALRGLYSANHVRVPIYFYLGNRERAGKDYCAGIVQIVHTGEAIEDSPLSTSDYKAPYLEEELRKQLISSFMTGRRLLHFANCRGHIDNAEIERASTSSFYEARLLGVNKIVKFENDMEFSLSGNIGITHTDDFENRCIKINLFLDIEDANSRTFSTPNLHAYISEHRSEILSALYSLIKKWWDAGAAPGKVAFTSFSQWAEICGGIMEFAGLGNPCIRPEKMVMSTDTDTSDMRELFNVCFADHKEQWLNKQELQYICKDNNIFDMLDFNNRAHQIKFGKTIERFVGRILGDIKMSSDENPRTARRKFIFAKNFQADSGQVVTNGTSSSQTLEGIGKKYSEYTENAIYCHLATDLKKCFKSICDFGDKTAIEDLQNFVRNLPCQVSELCQMMIFEGILVENRAGIYEFVQ